MMDARVDQNDVRWTDILMESMDNMSKTSGISTYRRFIYLYCSFLNQLIDSEW
jgi:hypothetical protein